MVHFKVTDGSQTRRFEAPSGLTYDQLKKKLSSLFPDAVKEDSNLVLHYRDSDGDIITLSSDQELQEVLNAADDKVLKFYLSKPVTSRKPHGNSSFRSFWSPSSTSVGDLFDKEVREFAKLLDTLSKPRQPSSSDSTSRSTDSTPATPGVERTETGTNETGSDEEVLSKPASEAASDGEDVKSKSASTEDEEVKAKPDPKATSTENECKSQRCSIYGGLAPLLLSDILFRPPATRPVGYRITWTPCGLGCSC